MVDAAVVAAAGAAVEAKLLLVVRSVDIGIAAGLAVDSVLASVETNFMNNVLPIVEDDYAENPVAEAEAVVVAEVEALA